MSQQLIVYTTFGISLLGMTILVLDIALRYRRPRSAIVTGDVSAPEETDGLQHEPMLEPNDPSPPVPIPEVAVDHASGGLPAIRVSRRLLVNLVAGICKDIQGQPGAETGFALIGRVEGEGPGRQIIINGLIDAGDQVDRSACHVRFDRDYQQRELERLQFLDPRSSHMGDAHLHPGSLDHCSSGDYQTDLANVRTSRSGEMVFVIATLARAHHRSAFESCLLAEPLKLDFFYLGEASDYEYRKFLPRIVDEPVLEVPDLLRELERDHPGRLRHELDCLRRIDGLRLRLAGTRIDDQTVPALHVCENQGKWTAVILLDGYPKSPPRVYVEKDGSEKELHAPFLDGQWSPYVWLAAVVLFIQSAMQAEPEDKIVVSSV